MREGWSRDGNGQDVILAGAVPLDLSQLKVATCAVVKLGTQPAGVLQQVVLRPDKVSRGGLIRLGDTVGDEAVGWLHPASVLVVEILGHATAIADDKVTVVPFEAPAERAA